MRVEPARENSFARVMTPTITAREIAMGHPNRRRKRHGAPKRGAVPPSSRTISVASPNRAAGSFCKQRPTMRAMSGAVVSGSGRGGSCKIA